MTVTYEGGEGSIDPSLKKKKRAFSKLEKLGKERLAAVKGLIAKQESSLMIARVIQQDWKQCQDVSEDSLRRQIDRFRATARTVMSAITLTEDPVERRELIADVRSQMDTLAELTELAFMEKGRIQATIEREKKVGLPFQWLTNDIRCMRDLIRTIADLQFDLGIHQRFVPAREIAGSISLSVDPESQAAMSALRHDELNQSQLARASASIVQMLHREVGDMLEEDAEWEE